jgi:uncharacterized protein with NRDE domain
VCLIALALNQHPEWPFILIANRDEFYDRPTQRLGFWPDAPILAGRDRRAGGSWLGIARSGRLAAITNYRDGRAPAPQGPSRGTLVSAYLRADIRADAYRPDPRIDAGYNLLWADREGLYAFGNRGPGIQRLDHGIHTLSNALLNTPWPKTERLRRALHSALQTSRLRAGDLLALLCDEQQAPDAALPDTGIPLQQERLLSRTFIRSEDYGTRARTLVMQRRNGETRVVEVSHDRQGICGCSDYRLTLPRLAAG